MWQPFIKVFSPEVTGDPLVINLFLIRGEREVRKIMENSKFNGYNPDLT